MSTVTWGRALRAKLVRHVDARKALGGIDSRLREVRNVKVMCDESMQLLLLYAARGRPPRPPKSVQCIKSPLLPVASGC